MSAREAVQTAEDARAITVKRREEERLTQERAAAAEREAKAKAQAAAANAQHSKRNRLPTAPLVKRRRRKRLAQQLKCSNKQPRPPLSRPPATGLRQKQRAHPPWRSSRWRWPPLARHLVKRPKQKQLARQPS